MHSQFLISFGMLTKHYTVYFRYAFSNDNRNHSVHYLFLLLKSSEEVHC